MKKLLCCTIFGCLVAAGPAAAFDVALSGQVSRMAVLPDDAEADEVQF